MHAILEKKMEEFGSFIYENPLKVILFLIILLAFPISQVPKIHMDTSTEGFMHDDDPVLITYNKFREDFGRDERIILAVQTDNVFKLGFLQKLRELHLEIESDVPYLDEVTSLYKVRNTRGVKDTLITDDLLEPFPQNLEELKDIEKRAKESHLYKNLLLSGDSTMTIVILETDTYSHIGEEKVADEDLFEDEFNEIEESNIKDREYLTEKENSELLAKVHQIIKKYEQDDFKIYLAGSPSVNNSLKKQMQEDIQKFMKTTFLIITVFLFLVFRRVSAVVYPLLVVGLSLAVTVGSMAYMGVAFKLPTQIVPSLLLAVCIGATVHILSIFFDSLNKNKDKGEALKYTMGHSGLAIAMTSVTTAIGVGSFSGSGVAPISDLGVFAAFGVMVALLLTLTLLPALLSITPLKPKEIEGETKIDFIMKKFAIIPIRYTNQILLGSAFLVALSIFFASKLELSHNPINWFEKDNINRYSTETIDEVMNGTVSMEVLIGTKEENGWRDPQNMTKLDYLSQDIAKYTDEYTRVGKVISLATIVKETNKALHENKDEFYTIPKAKDLLSQELLLFENSGSDDLEDVVDSSFSKTRMTIILPWTDCIYAMDILEYVDRKSHEVFKDKDVQVTGMVPLLVNTFANSVRSAVDSYIIAGIGISLMMILILGSLRIGLLSMIPNLTPILVGLFVMYILDIPLDMFTLLIGSIAIGLAVDDTIHFMHNFQRYYRQTKDPNLAVEKTFFTTGKAMLITTIVLSLGFYSYMAADMISVFNFGLLTGSVIIFALLSDLILAPALMITAAKRGWIK